MGNLRSTRVGIANVASPFRAMFRSTVSTAPMSPMSPISPMSSASTVSNPAHSAAVIVTGAAGFIGSHTAIALLRRGQRVIGIDNFDPFYPREIKERNLARIRASLAPDAADAFTFIETDITDSAAMLSACARAATFAPTFSIIHLAAKAGVRPSVDDPAGYTKTNVLGTSVILDAAHKSGAKRIIIASSSSVYGNCASVPFDEDMDVSKPISPYAATKRACELIAHTHWHLTQMQTAMLRFFTVYGPGQRPDLAINLFMRKAAAGEQTTLYGSMNSSRDYTFINDIVAGILAAHDRIDRFGYRIWNLGNSSPVTLAELVSAIGQVVGRPMNVRNEPMRAGDVERTFACLKRSRAELDFAPATPFLKGLAAQWEDMQRARSKAES